MDAFLQQFQHLKIQQEEIRSATNNFDDTNRIGIGGFGKVYKGEVSHSKGRSMVAIKRLDPKHGQGKPEFLKEITMLSRYSHDNLISLLGYGYQGDEMILVYELASRGSLDRHLSSTHLSWVQRLKICIDAAKGLSYLHDPKDTHQRLIHCDMKSANILLDEQWNAKVADFGLSIMGPANEQQSVVITTAVGTHGYCDPQYAMTNSLTKESDVYSFGVVLFEVLCGRLCCTYRNNRVEKNYVSTWIESYKQKKLTDIIFQHPTIQPLYQSSLEIVSNIAYRCLKESREDRPKMSEILTELEIALESQEFSEWIPPFDYEEIIKCAEPPLNHCSNVELRKLLAKGVFLNGGKTWLLLNKMGEHCEMISFVECLNSDASELQKDSSSRFGVTVFFSHDEIYKARVKTRFLSPGITYTVNLVFKFAFTEMVRKSCELISLDYKLQGETKSSISYLAYEREDEWWMCELYQFTSDQGIIDLEILFEGFDNIDADGIEFWPIEKVEHKDENQTVSNSDACWEEKLPVDYKDIMRWSTYSVRWTTKKEAYSVIRKGFLIDDGKKWFYLDKNGKKCYLLSARMACIFIDDDLYPLSLPESRFGEVIWCDCWSINIRVKIQSQLVSSETTYASYLVYKLPKDQSGFEAPLLVEDSGLESQLYIFLGSPQTPVIRQKADQNTHNPANKPKIKGLPQQRNDGWMEVQIWEFETATTTEMSHMGLALITRGVKNLSGLIIEGVEFRPII